MSAEAHARPARRYDTALLRRITRWITTTNHKDIGILYMSAAFLFFLIGGLEAEVIRLQLGEPNSSVVTPDVFNQIFTMHGTTMIFLFAMPILIGFANYIVPLQIGARDMAFPRLNGMSFWMFLGGGLMLYSSFLLGGAPNAGWFAYAPLTTVEFSPTHGMDFWALGIALTGVGSTLGAINFIVTILNMRTRGMTLLKMPLFTWQVLVTALLIVFAMPALTVDAVLLFVDRAFGAPFFEVAEGGQPLLWQHLFWFFGHPEVYILILPAFGIISEVIPVFSRKRIFGYAAIVYSGIAIGFLGFTVWAHHMFTVGLSPIADAVFSLDSMIIAVPTSVKIFNWIATMWGGRLRIRTPLLFAIGFISMFVVGGLSGISLAVVPVDWQVEDSYYVVAHLHYVLFGGTVFAIFAGLYYWIPKMTGRFLSERIGGIQFWVMLIGFNLTFLPMHILGLLGMPRRVYTYDANLGWSSWNYLETIGSFIIALSVGIFVVNFLLSMWRGAPASGDPWNGHTLEWGTSSPPPSYNFAVLPEVVSRWPLLDRKAAGLPVPIDEMEHPAVHMPGGSIHPFFVALGLMLVFYGAIFTFFLVAIGAAIMFAAIVGLVYEPR
jgi:cytochrome c oxidase subunit I